MAGRLKVWYDKYYCINCLYLLYTDQSASDSSSKVTTGDQCLLCWFSPYHLSRQEILNVMWYVVMDHVMCVSDIHIIDTCSCELITRPWSGAVYFYWKVSSELLSWWCGTITVCVTMTTVWQRVVQREDVEFVIFRTPSLSLHLKFNWVNV